MATFTHNDMFIAIFVDDADMQRWLLDEVLNDDLESCLGGPLDAPSLIAAGSCKSGEMIGYPTWINRG